MFRRGIRKRKKRLYNIVSLLTYLSGNSEAYIWRTKVSLELEKELLGFGCIAQEVEE